MSKTAKQKRQSCRLNLNKIALESDNIYKLIIKYHLL